MEKSQPRTEFWKKNDPKTKRDYYINTKTKVTTWKLPTDGVIVEKKKKKSKMLTVASALAHLEKSSVKEKQNMREKLGLEIKQKMSSDTKRNESKLKTSGKVQAMASALAHLETSTVKTKQNMRRKIGTELADSMKLMNNRNASMDVKPMSKNSKNLGNGVRKVGVEVTEARRLLNRFKTPALEAKPETTTQSLKSTPSKNDNKELKRESVEEIMARYTKKYKNEPAENDNEAYNLDERYEALKKEKTKLEGTLLSSKKERTINPYIPLPLQKKSEYKMNSFLEEPKTKVPVTFRSKVVDASCDGFLAGGPYASILEETKFLSLESKKLDDKCNEITNHLSGFKDGVQTTVQQARALLVEIDKIEKRSPEIDLKYSKKNEKVERVRSNQDSSDSTNLRTNNPGKSHLSSIRSIFTPKEEPIPVKKVCPAAKYRAKFSL